MTKETAARVLEILKMTISGLCETEREAIDMGINALRNIPKKKFPKGSDFFNDYIGGYNDCVDDFLKGETDRDETNTNCSRKR